jgi:hypothetical protein
MDDSQKRKSRLEIGHVLFIGIAGYSKVAFPLAAMRE